MIDSSGVDQELQVNILAANACLSMNHQKHKVHMTNEPVPYENMYNTACVYLGNGQVLEAEQLLIKARSKVVSMTFV